MNMYIYIGLTLQEGGAGGPGKPGAYICVCVCVSHEFVYTQHDETLRRYSLMYMSEANLPTELT